MKVVDFNGITDVTDLKSLEAVLARRSANDENAFWMSHEESDFPVLSLLVRGSMAVVNYVPTEADPGARSIRNIADFENSGMLRFAINSNPADDVFVGKEAVVPFSNALEAAKEFFHVKHRPQSLEWFEL